jgi:hypothetical protein
MSGKLPPFALGDVIRRKKIAGHQLLTAQIETIFSLVVRY